MSKNQKENNVVKCIKYFEIFFFLLFLQCVIFRFYHSNRRYGGVPIDASDFRQCSSYKIYYRLSFKIKKKKICLLNREFNPEYCVLFT